MMVLALPGHLRKTIIQALRKADKREIGGILMAEHIGHNHFEVKELTVHKCGAFASFIRRIEDAIRRISSFFERTNHNYALFNYIGEWHSHPSFEPEPSSRDDASMRQIIQDPKIGANFVVLLIVKLDTAGQLISTLHTYLPDGSKHRSTVI